MLFNSFEYLIFLPLVYILYWLVGAKKLKLQNFLILVSSYVFYGWWDWRFLILIILSSAIDFFVALRIDAITKPRFKKAWLYVSIISNLGILCFFKYYNFFIDSWVELFAGMGYKMTPWTVNLVLPIGISFYTFQTMAYTVDVYRGKVAPCRDWVSFAAFVCFFPQLVAGPIERASDLLPQITQKRKFNYVQIVEGLRLILWGLFKKIVIADSLAPIVEEIFFYWRSQTGTTILMGGLFFSFQMYADFSGYSDIAIGSAKLLGIELKTNFRFPMLSRTMIEYWQRWHITLSTWFKDYVYIPMGGSRTNIFRASFNVFFIFFLSGLWHGANWPFVVWGVFHVLFYLPEFIYRKLKRKPLIGHIHNKFLKYTVDGLQIAFMWLVLSAARLFYRSPTIEQGALMLKKMIVMAFTPIRYEEYLWYIVVIMVIDILIRKNERNPIRIKNRTLRYSYYSCLILVILAHLDNEFTDFLYFQF